MSVREDKGKLAIREIAAEWVVLATSPTAMSCADRSALAAWLRSSPLHIQEYLRAEAAWQAMSGAVRDDATDVELLLRHRPDNVVAIHGSAREAPADPLPTEAPSSRLGGSKSRQRAQMRAPLRRRRWLVAAGLAAVLLIVTVSIQIRFGGNTFSTNVGEQRRLILADGSALELNTNSSVEVVFDDSARTLYLKRGEAFFSVARDAGRPFTVISHDLVVQALGTQFNVYESQGRTRVTVVEGRVSVVPRDPQVAQVTPAKELVAGTILNVSATGAMRSSAVKGGMEAQWRQKRLVFENESLENVIFEFNRYNTRQITLRDPALAALRISGTFDPNRPADLMQFLSQSGDARAIEAGAQILLVPSQD